MIEQPSQSSSDVLEEIDLPRGINPLWAMEPEHGISSEQLERLAIEHGLLWGFPSTDTLSPRGAFPTRRLHLLAAASEARSRDALDEPAPYARAYDPFETRSIEHYFREPMVATSDGALMFRPKGYSPSIVPRSKETPGSFRNMDSKPLGTYAGIFLDVDGSFFSTYDDKDSPAVLRLKALSQAGIPIALATGRPAKDLKVLLQPASNFTTVSILGRNGIECLSVIQNEWEKNSPNIPEDALPPLQVAKKFEEEVNALLGADGKASAEPYLALVARTKKLYEPCRTLSINTVYRKTIRGGDPPARTLQVVEALVRKHVTIPEGFKTRVAPDCLQILPDVLGKERMLEAFIERHGLHGQRVLRIGDQGQQGGDVAEILPGVRVGVGSDSVVLNHEDGWSVHEQAPQGRKAPAFARNAKTGSGTETVPDPAQSVCWLLDNAAYLPTSEAARAMLVHCIEREAGIQASIETPALRARTRSELTSATRALLVDLITSVLPETKFRQRILSIIRAVEDDVLLPLHHVEQAVRDGLADRLSSGRDLMENVRRDPSAQRCVGDPARAIADLYRAAPHFQDTGRAMERIRLLEEFVGKDSPLKGLLIRTEHDDIHESSLWREELLGRLGVFQMDREKKLLAWIRRAACTFVARDVMQKAGDVARARAYAAECHDEISALLCEQQIPQRFSRAVQAQAR